MPSTMALAPEDESVKMVFRNILSFPAAVVIPVTFPVPVMEFMLLPEVLFAPEIFTDITVTAPEAAVQFEKVLFWIFFVPLPPSVQLHPVIVVAPARVMLEKLFPD